MDEVGRVEPQRAGDRAHRPRLAAPARPDRRRLLRRPTTPLKQLANVAATDARLLTVTPYDKGVARRDREGDQESDVGLTPNNDGNVIRLQIPELTEERRREMVKVVHGVAEEGRVAVRNVRRDVMHDLRELKKEGDAGEDDERRAEADAAEADRRGDRRDRRAAQGQGRGDPRGLVNGRSLRGASATYVAIITDGNGAGRSSAGCRCSRATGPAPTTSRRRLRDAVELGIEELTVFSFSTENWSRPAGRGRGPDGDVRRADRLRDARARRGGRADALHRPPRGRRRPS